MQLPEFKRSYTWGALIGFEVGLRREITLFIRRYPTNMSERHSHKWKENRVDIVDSLTFDDVENLEEIEMPLKAMRRTKKTKRATLIVDWIGYDSQQKSKPDQLFIRVFFDWPGVGVTVQCSNFVESEDPS